MLKFGTSGFRGIYGDTWTKENIQTIGFAFRKLAESQGKPINIVIGHDTRFMGREAAIWFCEAACCDMVHATFMTVFAPTPFIAYKAVTVDFGIMVTASHNPSIYNGIKVFVQGGKECNDEFIKSLSAFFDKVKDSKSTPFEKLVNDGSVVFSDSTEDYENQIVSLLDIKKIKASNLKVLFNPMYGSGAAIMRNIYGKIGLPFHVINEKPDPLFGGSLPAPYPHVLVGMAEEVVKGKYNFGIAVDGDADRVALIDGDGKFYDCNYLAAALYYYLTQIKKQKGGAVKNFLTSSLINKLCKSYGFEVHETLVGFKFIGVPFESTDALIAAESGGMGFKAISLCKDGITTAAFLIDLAANMKKGIGAIIKEIAVSVSFPSAFVEYAYPFNSTERENVLAKLHAVNKPTFPVATVKIDTYYDGFKVVFKDDYWCAARLSGNENVLRMYAEMKDEKSANEVIDIMEKFYGMTERQK